MSAIVFYEKPGCAGNARQRALLEAAGHGLQRRDLLATRWTRESLLVFLAPLPVAQWFNRSATRVKRGEVQPEALHAEAALALLLADPLLIRRPLLQRADGARMVGFDRAQVDAFVGLGAAALCPARSLEGCVAAAASCIGHPDHKPLRPPCRSTTSAARLARPPSNSSCAAAPCRPARSAPAWPWSAASRAPRRRARARR
jgi:nitrogenase-associated protein